MCNTVWFGLFMNLLRIASETDVTRKNKYDFFVKGVSLSLGMQSLAGHPILPYG